MDTELIHLACISDFCGNYKHPGAWADLFQHPTTGKKVIRLGGGWEYYGQNTPEEIAEDSPHFAPFVEACDNDSDFAYARQHWN